MATATTTPSALTVYAVDPAHSQAQFKVRHLMISNVKGEFTKVAGRLRFDSSRLSESSVEAEIDAATINTREPQRDDHLRSADFFDVANHPMIAFRSTRIERTGSDYRVTGNLTIRGVTREVTLAVDEVTPEVKDPWGNVKFGASAHTRINRKEFGLVWNAALETGGVLVGDDVDITLDIEFTKQAA